MSLTLLEDKNDIAAAFDSLSRLLKENAAVSEGKVNHRGVVQSSRNRSLQRYWHRAYGFWASVELLDWSIGGNSPYNEKYWLCFGVEDPSQSVLPKTVVEINPLKSGVDRKFPGVFLTDGRNIVLGHLGRFSKMKPGSKAAFLKSYPYRQEIIWPDGRMVPVVLVGNLSSPSFLREVARFVYAVKAFKDDDKAKSIDDLIEQDGELAEMGGAFDPTTAEEGREKVYRSINLRRGQPKFRKKLLSAYGGRCAMSDCDCVDTLEAAHIQPYNGEKTNHVQNGLLLRSDLHVLFDLGKIGVDGSNLSIIVSDKIRNTHYGELHGRPLRVPQKAALKPSKVVLEEHRKKWML